MTNFFRKGKGTIVIISFSLILVTTTLASAIPYTGSILNNTNYSLVHNGSNPNGSCDPSLCLLNEYLRFADDAVIIFNLNLTGTGGDVSTAGFGTQFYSLTGVGVGIATFELRDLSFSFNSSNRVTTGYMDYRLRVPTTLTTGSTDIDRTERYNFSDPGFSSWNSVELSTDTFKAYLWGGDVDNDNTAHSGLGIDFVFWGTPAPVPEPGTLMLLGSGLVGMFAFRKKIRKNV